MSQIGFVNIPYTCFWSNLQKKQKLLFRSSRQCIDNHYKPLVQVKAVLAKKEIVHEG